MARSLVARIAGAWRAPRAAMAELVAEGLSEPRALFHLMAACGLYLVASLPNALRQARTLEIDDPVSGAVAAHLFGHLFLAPLLAYGAAAAVHLGARAFGASGGFLAARSALFWALFAGTPLALGLALLGVAGEALGGPAVLPLLSVLGYAGLACWLWLFAASLAEAEGFAATHRVAAVFGVAFVCVAAGLALLAGGGAAG